MTHKAEKKGPELFFVDEQMCHGLQVLADIAKKQNDNSTSDFLMLVKTGLSKIISITPEMVKLAAELRRIGAEKIKLAEYIEQLFPESKK